MRGDVRGFMFIAERRRCPRCHETAQWVGLTADVEVRLRVNLVPAGSYHSPSRAAMYSCSGCGYSFKLLPKFGQMMLIVAAVLGALIAVPLLLLPHSIEGPPLLPWIVVLAILGLSLGFLAYDSLLRMRAPVLRR